MPYFNYIFLTQNVCFAVAEVGGAKENLFGSKIKEEPVDPIFEDEDDCMSDEYGDPYGEAFGDHDVFDEDDAFAHSKFSAINDTICRSNNNPFLIRFIQFR